MDLEQPTLVLDQATKTTGYSIYVGRKLITYGTIKSFYDNTNDRIFEISNNVDKLIKEHNIKNITFEDIFLDSNLNVYKQLAFLLGTLINVATKNKLNYTTINVLEWKKYYGIDKLGDRTLGKNISKQIVLNNIGISVVDDVSDSILMGHYLMGVKIEEEYKWD